MSRLSRLANVFRAERVDGDLHDELRFHIEARTEDLISSGMTPRAAADEARRRLGSQLRLREHSRDIKLYPWLDSVLQDTRFGLRMLNKSRLLTLAAVLSLSLAIGASAGAFALLDALVLRPLPVPDPDRLVFITSSGPGRFAEIGGDKNHFFSYSMLERLREAGRGTVDLFGVTYGGTLQSVVIDGSSEGDETIRTQWISGGGLAIAGVQPALGKWFPEAADLTPGPSSAVISHSYWKRRFGGNPAVLGQWLTLTLKEMKEGARFQIVGVAPEGFSGLEPGQPTDIWFPLLKRSPMEWESRPFADYFYIWGRLKPGVAAGQAMARLQGPFTDLRRKWTTPPPQGMPPQMAVEFRAAQLHMRPIADLPSNLRFQFAKPLWILAVIVGLVLLIACSNVANLFLARAAAREREMAMRSSIGARRARLIQQVLIESCLVACAACVLGLGFAMLTAPAIVKLMGPSDFPAYLDLRPDGRMFAFLAVVGALTTILFGLGPAWGASIVSPNDALRAGTDRQSPRRGVLRPLLAAQVGLSFVVLFIAGLLLLSFHNLTHVDLGFSKDRVILFTLRLIDPKSEEPPATAAHLLESVRKLPDVQAAGLSEMGLIGGQFARRGLRVHIPGRVPEPAPTLSLWVSPGFFEAMQIGLLEGRYPAAGDVAPRPNGAVVVNQAFGAKFFPGESPVGKRFSQIERSGESPREIVGVVRDAKYNTLRDRTAPTVYTPMMCTNRATLEVRVAGDPAARASALKAEIEAANPSIRVTSVILQSARIDNTLLKERLLALLAGFFGVVAIVLAAVGLYGVLNYSVVERTKELGIRMALGAQHLVVIRLVMADIFKMIAMGIALGVGAAIALAQFRTEILYGVNASDLVSFAVPLACLLTAAGLAALPGAVRAVRVDPMVALRHE